jgi:rfaE bifunctional protein kinase chain/domain
LHRHPNPTPWIAALLDRLPKLTVTVFGDFCLDAYWLLNTSSPEISVETGLPIHRVESQRYSLGGAGNVVANLAAMGVGELSAVGLLGYDLFGGKMLELLGARKVTTSGMLRDQTLQTMVYAKPCTAAAEHNRIDFGGFNTYSAELVERLLAELERAFAASDMVVINQQVPASVVAPPFIERINGLIAAHPRVSCIVDSRHFAEHFRGAILKLNTPEAARVLGESAAGDYTSLQAHDFAGRIHGKTAQAAFITRGKDGLIAIAQDGTLSDLPALQISGLVDTVGAGDAVVAGLAAALAAGETVAHAAEFANIAASITVRQMQTTGTATPEQLREAAAELNYVFAPELAASTRGAKYFEGSEIELVTALPETLAIKHCVFDHDGTLSVLREGWESIMEPFMLRAILGRQHDTVDAAVFAETQRQTRDLISRTTGIQTLVQMRGLVDLIRQLGYAADTEILDEHGYKAQFNTALLQMIAGRVEKLRTGELAPADFQIKNAVGLLDALYSRGVKLYLASGTDRDDVVAEATALGYAHYFEGRIFGATDDPDFNAKAFALDKIIRENDLAGHELAMFGDGPVEIRETQRRGGLAIGVASDELRRFGLNAFKRERLIRAGANLIVADYSQLPALLKVLQIG